MGDKKPMEPTTVREAKTGKKREEDAPELPQPPKEPNMNEVRALGKKKQIAIDAKDQKLRAGTAETAQAALMLVLELLNVSTQRDDILASLQEKELDTPLEKAARTIALKLLKSGERE